MKKKSTIKSLCIAAALTMCSVASYAATITATVSGNWSSASTWSGGTAGTNITLDNIVIPAGITVTLDQNVQFASLLASLSVNGSLTSTTTNSLTITSLSTLSGNGSLNLRYLELGTSGGMTFSGTATIYRFVTSATTLNLASQITLMDTLHLRAGALSLNTGSNLTLGSNSNIKVEDGTLTTGGGLFTGTNSYNVLYVGGSKTTGIEMNGAGFNNFNVQLSSGTQNLTLGSNTTVNGTLYHTMGNLVLNGKTLTIKGGYSTSNNGGITGSATSNLVIQTSAALASPLTFNAGSRTLNNLEIDITSAGNANLGSDLALSGDLKLTKGSVSIINNSTLTMNAGSSVTRNEGTISTSGGGTFNGTAAYNVNYVGGSKTSALELTGSGLNNVMLQMTNATDSVKINANTTIKGMLSLTKGSFNLNGKTLTLQGSFSSSSNGWLQANGGSSGLVINTTGNVGDTLMFASNMNHLNSLTMNTGNSTNAMIGSALFVETILFTNGGITIINNDLTVNATGSISGSTNTKYVQINGTGSLVMNVNSPSTYVMFPIGTSTSLGAAYIQRNSGSGMIGVSTHNGIWSMGTSGNNNATTESVVDRTWDIKSVSTGSVDLNIKLEWASGMEQNGFDRTQAFISHYSNSLWDVQTATTASVVGTGLYQISRNNVTSLSPFAVVDKNSEVGIEESTLAAANLYPNPTSDKLNITIPDGSNFSVEVFDGMGNLVLSKAVTDANSRYIDLAPLAGGIYFVKVSNANTQTVKRVVKQ